MKLNEIRDNQGARKKRMRVGRGIGSGKGKTGGRGGKGQTARSGVAINGFEGGQMPIHRRLPKRGFKSINKQVFQVVNLGDLQKAVDAGKLKKDANTETLVEAGLIRRSQQPVKLLAKGELTAKLTIEVAAASEAAVEGVKKAGGDVKISA